MGLFTGGSTMVAPKPVVPAAGAQPGASSGALPPPIAGAIPAAAGRVGAFVPSAAASGAAGAGRMVAGATSVFSPGPNAGGAVSNAPAPGAGGGLIGNVQRFAPSGAPPNGGSAPVQPNAPNYTQILESQPGYMAAENAAANAQANAGSARQQTIDQALLQYGGTLPPGFQDKYGDIISTMLGQAAANPYSEVAMQSRANADAIAQMKAGLAANGMLSSGQLPNSLNEQSFANGKNLYDLANSFLSTAGNAYQTYLGVLNTNQGNLQNALLSAEQAASNNPAYWTTGPGAKALHAGSPGGEPVPSDMPTGVGPTGYGFQPRIIHSTPSTVGPVAPSYAPLTTAEVAARNRRQAA